MKRLKALLVDSYQGKITFFVQLKTSQLTGRVFEVRHHDVKVHVVGNPGLDEAMNFDLDGDLAVGIALISFGLCLSHPDIDQSLGIVEATPENNQMSNLKNALWS